MKIIGRIVGYVMWVGAGLLMFIFWFMAMTKWLGFLGSVLAIVLTPGLVIFPIIFWIVEHVFPTFYFIIFGIGIIGAIIGGLCSDD
jgi:hypothetical protein